jgi:hypothetical protein
MFIVYSGDVSYKKYVEAMENWWNETASENIEP